MDSRPGYKGWLTLVSPDGSQQENYYHRGRFKGSAGVVADTGDSWTDPKTKAYNERRDRQFRRLLSQGWKVVPAKPAEVEAAEDGETGKEEKKNTSVVDGSTQTGDQSHGGKHASGEVENSPNHAKRGCRGSRGGDRKEARREQERQKRMKPQPALKLGKCAQKGGGAVYCPQPFQTSEKMRASAEKSAKLLAELVGRSEQKTISGTTVDVEGLLVALEVGDNPLPYLEVPQQRPRLRVLITPDCSGSTQGWSGLGRAWTTAIAKMPDVDVLYVENNNGALWSETYGPLPDAATQRLLQDIDVLIYLGDGDGMWLCERYAESGATVVGLDSYCASVAKPRLEKEWSKVPCGRGSLYWVTRCSAKEPETWYEALRVVLGNHS